MPIIKFFSKVILITMLGLTIFAQALTKPRVFIASSQSWEISGRTGGADDAMGGQIGGGARPQTAEIVKTFNDRCPDFTVTTKQDRADYVVVIEHEGGKSVLSKDTKYVVYNKDGDGIESGATRSIGLAVKETCAILKKDHGSHTAGIEEKKN